ncbi:MULTISPECIES: ParA family protein [Gammaproteobacteria]|uniref:ParA family protein n=1 Tax=Gammaproteobacteria TaxID=1236 RepID=UPI003A959C99
MKTIVFFNNKGGVGKTTLACNLVSYLKLALGKRVLLVDADPQCNATQAILTDEECENIYLEDAPELATIYSCLKPFEDGEPSIKTGVKPISGGGNRFGVDIIPGHPKMSTIEDILSDGWSELKARQIRGHRITNWCHHLTSELASEYDYIVFDVGPSLGALNRSVILASDYIVTPFGCDIFSLLGIRNIAGWITAWKQQYDSSIAETDAIFPGRLDEYSIIRDTDAKFRFAGYSVQQYVTRKFKSGARPVKSYDRIMQDIPETATAAMSFLSPKHEVESFELGHIPYLYSLIPMAQAARSPIHQLKGGDGLVGSQYAQVASYAKLMSSICDRLMANIGEEIA